MSNPSQVNQQNEPKEGRGLTGTLELWFPQKGFGFILPEGGTPGNNIFVQAQSFVDGEKSVQRGETVTYDCELSGRTGKFVALNVQKVKSFDADTLPCKTRDGKLVAYQFIFNSPWRLFGPGGSENEFKWIPQPLDVVSRGEKAQIKRELQEYAASNGLRVEGLKMALLTQDNLWVSISGATSSNSLQ